MKKASVLLAIFLSGFMFVGCGEKSASTYLVEPREGIVTQYDFSDIANDVNSAIVTVYSATNQEESLGSGVCVSQYGHILTNSHVVLNGADNTVYFSDGTSTQSNLVYRDSVRDIAILKINVNSPSLSIGDIDEVCVGDEIIACGTPLTMTFQNTFTKGIISALDRCLEVTGDGGVSYMQGLIQHDASINPGNSGGALINSKGELIGINTLKVSSYEGLGFAIPASNVKGIIQNLIQSDNYELPYIGIMGFDSKIAKQNGVAINGVGYYVACVDSDSPASRVGIEVGDVITQINGQKICKESDLIDILAKYKAGQVLNIQYTRNNTQKNVILNVVNR